MILVPAVNLIVQKKIVEHSLQACQLSSFEPGEHICAERHVHPLAEILRFGHAHFAELWPDWDSPIRREGGLGKPDIGELTTDFAHCLERDDAGCLCFFRIA